MAIDMSQFLDTFYEESFEGLDIMESELLNLDEGDADSETINTIFRAAHSIKGGSGTFGLNAVAEFTHVLETLLDEMRDGRRQPTKQANNLLLASVDVLRGMLTALRDNTDLETDRIAETHKDLETLLNHGGDTPSETTVTSNEAADTSADTIEGWHIVFKPHRNLFATGNDPLRIIRELETLGELSIELDDAKLPAFADLEPEECYLGWTAELTKLNANVDRSAVEEVFSWVDDECDLEITPITQTESTKVVNITPASQSPAAAPAPTERRTDDRRKAERRTPGKASAESSSIRVGIDKIDSVINLVGELVITQSMLSTLGDNFDINNLNRMVEGLEQLDLNTRQLQEEVMRMRMMPISFAFQRFPRLVHDYSQKNNKKIELLMTGEQTELDKTVMEKIGDPLTHLVRNSLDHGLETPEDRVAAGKSEMGTINLNAYHQGGNIVIEIRDDGRGLNADKIRSKAIEKGLIDKDANIGQDKIYELIMLPGFSTADVVTDVSGRGVGMDVVVKNIQALGGQIEVQSEAGKGSVFTIRLPLTLAILDGQTVAVGKEDYIVPLVSIIESIQLRPDMLNVVVGKGETFKLRDEHLPIIRLHNVFGAEPVTTDLTKGLLVVVEGEGRKVGLFVDELRGQQQVVIKSLEANYKRIEGISGATILGDGSVALILDIPGLIKLSNDEVAEGQHRKIA